jgi:hypothetical protein
MPIEYERDDRRRLITLTLTDPVSFDDLLGQTDRQWNEHTWEYAILYDSRPSVLVVSISELDRLVERTRVVGAGQERGPVGVAIRRSPETFRTALQLPRVAGRNRDIEILLNDAQIAVWLTRHAPRRVDE